MSGIKSTDKWISSTNKITIFQEIRIKELMDEDMERNLVAEVGTRLLDKI